MGTIWLRLRVDLAFTKCGVSRMVRVTHELLIVIKRKKVTRVKVTFISIPYIGRLIFVKCANARIEVRIRFI